MTSVKREPVAAMLVSQAEVAGLHPMTAPPKSPTLKGRVLVVCEARLSRWSEWLQQLCAALEAECVRSAPDHHDRVMALVQAMVHASHMAQAGVLRAHAPTLGSLDALMPYRSASFELDTAIIARILALNPAIYEDIQFGNPHVGGMLDGLIAQLSRLRDRVGRGDDAARAVPELAAPQLHRLHHACRDRPARPGHQCDQPHRRQPQPEPARPAGLGGGGGCRRQAGAARPAAQRRRRAARGADPVPDVPGRTDVAALAQRHGIDFASFFRDELQALAPLCADGLAEHRNGAIQAPARGDRYLRQPVQGARYSQAI